MKMVSCRKDSGSGLFSTMQPRTWYMSDKYLPNECMNETSWNSDFREQETALKSSERAALGVRA